MSGSNHGSQKGSQKRKDNHAWQSKVPGEATEQN